MGLSEQDQVPHRVPEPQRDADCPKAASLARIPLQPPFRSLPERQASTQKHHSRHRSDHRAADLAIMQQPMATASVRLFFRLGVRYHRKVYKTAVKNSRTIRQSLFRNPPADKRWMEADQGVSQRDRPAAEGLSSKSGKPPPAGAGIKAGQKLERLCELRLIRYAKPLEYLTQTAAKKGGAEADGYTASY